MGAMTLQTITPDGLAPAYAAVADGDTIAVAGSDRVLLQVKNDDAAAITVTVAALRTTAAVPGVGTVDIPDISVSVPAGGERLIGPFNSAYADALGTVTVNYDAVSNVTAAALALQKGA